MILIAFFINAIFFFISFLYNKYMKKIICISGKQYSGKDTVAKILLDKFSDFKRVGIADSIKFEFGRINNLTFDEIESNKGKYRTALIELGNKGRKINPDFWINKILDMDENIIIPDVRLLHEAIIFKNAGAFLIRVQANYDIRAKRGIITNSNDNTEIELDNYNGFDYIIENNSTYDVLSKDVMLLADILSRRFI